MPGTEVDDKKEIQKLYATRQEQHKEIRNRGQEIEKLKTRIKLLESVIEEQLYMKAYFQPWMECRFCHTVKGNGHNTDCRIGLILMGLRNIPEREDGDRNET